MAVSTSNFVLNHQNLLRRINGGTLATHHHSLVVELVLEDRRTVSFLLDEAWQLAHVAGPNNGNRQLIYDGQQVLVAAEDAE